MLSGGVAERFNAPVLKTGGRKPTWVRIPPPPLVVRQGVTRFGPSLGNRLTGRLATLLATLWRYRYIAGSVVPLWMETLMETLAMAETKPLYVRLPADLHLRLKITAANRERPMSELVVEAIVEYLERTEASHG